MKPKFKEGQVVVGRYTARYIAGLPMLITDIRPVDSSVDGPTFIYNGLLRESELRRLNKREKGSETD